MNAKFILRFFILFSLCLNHAKADLTSCLGRYNTCAAEDTGLWEQDENCWKEHILNCHGARIGAQCLNLYLEKAKKSHKRIEKTTDAASDAFLFVGPVSLTASFAVGAAATPFLPIPLLVLALSTALPFMIDNRVNYNMKASEMVFEAFFTGMQSDRFITPWRGISLADRNRMGGREAKFEKRSRRILKENYDEDLVWEALRHGIESGDFCQNGRTAKIGKMIRYAKKYIQKKKCI